MTHTQSKSTSSLPIAELSELRDSGDARLRGSSFRGCRNRAIRKSGQDRVCRRGPYRPIAASPHQQPSDEKNWELLGLLDLATSSAQPALICVRAAASFPGSHLCWSVSKLPRPLPESSTASPTARFVTSATLTFIMNPRSATCSQAPPDHLHHPPFMAAARLHGG